MTTFSSRDVMRFLDRTRLPARGGVDVRFNGQMVSDMRERPEGIRVKHHLDRIETGAQTPVFFTTDQNE